jgi:hypothetical protein
MASNILDEIPDLKTVGEADELSAIPDLKTVNEEELAAIPNLKEIPDEPEKGGIFEGKDITQAEIQDIASRNQTDPELLKMFAPYLGRSVEGEKGAVTTARRTIGFVSEALGGLPTWVAKKAQDPNVEKAIDELNELTERKKSYAQKGTEIAAGLVTPTAMVAQTGSRAALAGAGALESAGFALGESKSGEELKQAAMGAGIGAIAGTVLAPLILRGGKAGKLAAEEPLSPTGIDELKQIATPDTVKILDTVEQEVAGKVPGWERELSELLALVEDTPKTIGPADIDDLKGKMPDELKELLLDFSDKLGGPRTFDGAINKVRELKATLAPEDLQKAYTRWRTIKTVGDDLEKLAVNEPRIATELRAIKDFFIDFSSVARDMDRRLGIDVSGTLLEATKRTNLYQVALRDYLKGKLNLNSSYEKLAPELQTEVADALDGVGAYANMTREQIAQAIPDAAKDNYLGWRKFFDDAATKVKTDYKLPLETRANYLPHQMMDMPRVIVAIEKKIEEAAKGLKINPLSLPANYDLSQVQRGTPLDELVRAIHYLTGKEPTNGAELSAQLKQAIQPGGSVYADEIKASALLQRTNLMPKFIQERDVRKLSTKWGQQVYRYANLKNSLADLRYQAELLRKSGNVDDAIKLERLHDEFLGQARFLAKTTRQAAVWFQTRALRLAERQEEGAIKGFYNFLAESPDMFQNMVLNVYPNFLGASPRAAIQNLTGGLYMMIPELGFIYGTRAVVPAYLKALANVGKESYREQLERAGFLAPQWTTELREAIRTGRPPGLVGQSAEKLSNAVMWMFEFSERINRAVAYETGKFLAKDAAAGDKLALKYLNTMPERIRKDTLKYLAKKDDEKSLEKAQDLITRYLADRTLFSYNRITSSELSRAIGPLFSMFSKYPSAISGRIADIFQERGAVKGGAEFLRFFVAPLMAGVGINAILTQPGSNLETWLFGEPKSPDASIWARGATSSSPIFAVKSILEGRQFQPPLVATAKELTMGGFELFEGDPDRLGRAMRNAARAFTPGGAQAIVSLTEQLSGKDIPILGKEE